MEESKHPFGIIKLMLNLEKQGYSLLKFAKPKKKLVSVSLCLFLSVSVLSVYVCIRPFLSVTVHFLPFMSISVHFCP